MLRQIPKLLAIFFLGFVSSAQAQLRIVTYNTTGPPDAGMNIVLRSIGEEIRAGIAKPIDILLLQEQSNLNPGPGPNNPSPDTQQFVTLLNNIYSSSGITYSMSNRTGAGGSDGFGSFTQTLVYRTQTVDLIADIAVGSVSSSGAARQPLRFQMRPKGYDSSADFFIYNSHYKSSQGTECGTCTPNAIRRENEALMIRADANLLPPTAHIIYAGDHNFYDFDADEPAVARLRAAGNGQADDPVNQVGPWHENSQYALYHTQSPCTSGCGAGGGMDDRFDFQWVSTDMLDGEGLDYIPGTYRTFGNNGSTYNTAINNGNTYNFAANGVTTHTKTAILNALASVTDHLPVVADYQLPAVLQAVAGAVPARINFGQTFNLGVTVSNAASVLVALGADELDYSVTGSGAVSGTFLNQTDAALGGGNMHQMTLNTSTLGLKTGTITVTSPSPMVQNGTVNIPISYLVALAGDYDQNGTVDVADYILWRDTLGQDVNAFTGADGSGNGVIDPADYGIWTANFGHSAGSSLGAGLVPEPTATVLLLIGVSLVSSARGTLREWTRKS